MGGNASAVLLSMSGVTYSVAGCALVEETEHDLESSHRLPTRTLGCSRNNKRLGEQRAPARRNEDQVKESNFFSCSLCPSLLCLTSTLRWFSVFSGEKETTAEEPGSPVKSVPASPAQSPVKLETKSPVVSPSKSLDGELS